jgi:hypothetical protein
MKPFVIGQQVRYGDYRGVIMDRNRLDNGTYKYQVTWNKLAYDGFLHESWIESIGPDFEEEFEQRRLYWMEVL